MAETHPAHQYSKKVNRTGKMKLHHKTTHSTSTRPKQHLKFGLALHQSPTFYQSEPAFPAPEIMDGLLCIAGNTHLGTPQHPHPHPVPHHITLS